LKLKVILSWGMVRTLLMLLLLRTKMILEMVMRDMGMGRVMVSRLMGGIPQLALIIPTVFKIQVIMLQTLGL
jgi:hypothetical protein